MNSVVLCSKSKELDLGNPIALVLVRILHHETLIRMLRFVFLERKLHCRTY